MTDTIKGMIDRGLRELSVKLGQRLAPEEAIPGDRPGQIAVLLATGLFHEVRLDELTDLVVEVATLVVRNGGVVGASQALVKHGGHQETGLELVVQMRDLAMTLVLLPCGKTDIGGLEMRTGR